MILTEHDMPGTHWLKTAKANGINPDTYYARLGRGWSKRRSATEAVRKVDRCFEGSTRRKLRNEGLSQSSVYSFRYRNPETTMTDDEIIEEIKRRKARVTLKSMAKTVGINYDTLLDRLRRGWELEEALKTPLISNRTNGLTRARENRKNKLGQHAYYGAQVRED